MEAPSIHAARAPEDDLAVRDGTKAERYFST